MLKPTTPIKDANSDEFHEFTHSSILEFLNQEQQCMDMDSEMDIESIFEEINRLSSNDDDRGVEEILEEVQQLMSERSDNGVKLKRKNGETGQGEQPSEILPIVSKSAVQERTEYNEHSIVRDSQMPNSPKNHLNVSSVSIKKNNTIVNGNDGVDDDFDDDDDDDTIIKPEREENVCDKLTLNETRMNDRAINFVSAYDHNVGDPDRTFTVALIDKCICTHAEYIDKSTSPTHGSPKTTWNKERLLSQQVDILEEQLKDTEERLQSLRIQHDSLSQIHRALRDNNTLLHDESEKLKFEVQNLTECTNILRNELHCAKYDRSESIELQKLLQLEIEKEKIEKKKLQDQTTKESKTIQDLQRQCKEMERILIRKYPDSVSALIVASKNSSTSHDESLSGRHLLEQRIVQLESDARNQDDKAQKILANVQARFSSVQTKYETHIRDLETQVLSLQEINSKLNEKIEGHVMKRFHAAAGNLRTSYTQTDDVDNIPEHENSKTVNTRTNATQTDTKIGLAKSSVPIRKSKTANSMSEQTKEDAHLMATIRGMRVDLAIKDKAFQRLTRELDDLKKSHKKLIKDREAMVREKSLSGGISSKKIYDPAQFTDNGGDLQSLKDAQSKIKLLEYDYKVLHEKRLQDLKTLQAAHERELRSSNETIKILQKQNVEHDTSFDLQSRSSRLPVDYYSLKAKVASLERRHSEREQRLHLLVEALSKGRLNSELNGMGKLNGVEGGNYQKNFDKTGH